jgi:hypothetical protein
MRKRLVAFSAVHPVVPVCPAAVPLVIQGTPDLQTPCFLCEHESNDSEDEGDDDIGPV